MEYDKQTADLADYWFARGKVVVGRILQPDYGDAAWRDRAWKIDALKRSDSNDAVTLLPRDVVVESIVPLFHLWASDYGLSDRDVTEMARDIAHELRSEGWLDD